MISRNLTFFLVLAAIFPSLAISQVCPTQTVFSLEKGFDNRTFTMALQVAPPFVSYNAEATGTDSFSGLTIDIASLLERELSCKFEFVLANDKSPESSSAAVRSVVSSSGSTPGAQIAGGAIEITTERSNMVHFTIPYYDTGYIMIVQKPAQTPSLWHFFGPFQTALWVAVLVEMLVVAILCYLMESPFLSSIKDSDVVDGGFEGFFDSLYWSITLLLQNPDKAPRTWGGKLVMMAHGWFMLIIVASYTANLASFLTASFTVPAISDWNTVLNSQGRYKLALPAGGLHQAFIEFEQKQFPKAVFNVNWTDTWESAVKLVSDGLADATFHDEPIVQDYIVREGLSCKVMETGKIFNVFGYGFAFNYASLDFIPFSQAIVSLKETGEIGQLLRNYQIGPFQKTSTESCTASSEDQSFSFRDMLGLFLMTSGVIFVGFVINACELISHGKLSLGCKGKLHDPSTSEPREKVIDDLDKIANERLSLAFSEAVRQGILLSLKSMCEGMRDKENTREVDFKSELLSHIDSIIDSSKQNGSKLEEEFMRKDCVGDKLLYGKVSLIELDDQMLKQLRMFVDEWL